MTRTSGEIVFDSAADIVLKAHKRYLEEHCFITDCDCLCCSVSCECENKLKTAYGKARALEASQKGRIRELSKERDELCRVILVKGDTYLEGMAKLAHKAWSDWMRRVFRISRVFAADTFGGREAVIPKDAVGSWMTLCNTPYEDLQEIDKEVPRQEARRALALVRPLVHNLKRKLKIAIDALERYADEDNWDKGEDQELAYGSLNVWDPENDEIRDGPEIALAAFQDIGAMSLGSEKEFE